MRRSVRDNVTNVTWLLFILSLFFFASGVSWQLSKVNNFFYETWYKVLNINNTIVHHVSKNTQGKNDFPVENTQLHAQIFANIVDAIHQQGDGLVDIHYLNRDKNSRQFLTKNEIIHLQDVAHLIDNLRQFWFYNLFFLSLFIFFYLVKEKEDKSKRHIIKSLIISITMPYWQSKCFIIIVFMMLIITMLAIWGATPIFYYLHTIVFPENHQWFFYYHESLMTTLMKAPDIFAVITGQLVMITLIIVVVIEQLVTTFSSRQ